MDNEKGGKLKIPPLTQQPIKYVDMTPTDDLALRILRAYRADCNCRWVTDTDGSTVGSNPLLLMMNQHQEQRAEILDKAIGILEKGE